MYLADYSVPLARERKERPGLAPAMWRSARRAGIRPAGWGHSDPVLRLGLVLPAARLARRYQPGDGDVADGHDRAPQINRRFIGWLTSCRINQLQHREQNSTGRHHYISFGQKAIGLAAVQHASHKASEHEAKKEEVKDDKK
jgi:hypothetical protein